MLPATAAPTIPVWTGETVPVLGQGTWGMAEGKHSRDEELRALRDGIELGMTLIDTAEMYADGGAEELVGAAIRGRRDDVFVVSKVLPQHGTRNATIGACERSLRRLQTHVIDLYLLHWREQVPLQQTLDAFNELVKLGKIRYWGVSNFNADDLEELIQLPGGHLLTTDQVLYNLTRRGIEYDLLPWCRRRKIPIMAYSPIEQGRMLSRRELQKIARRHGATTAQVALAWVLLHDGVIAIPRAGVPGHVRENRAALELRLTEQDLADLNRAFPPPHGPQPLEML